MDAPQACSIKQEQIYVIRFLKAEGVSSEEIYRRLTAQYGDTTLDLNSVLEAIESGKKSDGGKVKVILSAAEKLERALDIIKHNRRISLEELSAMLQVSLNTASGMVHQRLGLTQANGRWVKRSDIEHYYQGRPPHRNQDG